MFSFCCSMISQKQWNRWTKSVTITLMRHSTEKFTAGAKKTSYSRKERKPWNFSVGIICDANILNETTDHFPSLILFDEWWSMMHSYHMLLYLSSLEQIFHMIHYSLGLITSPCWKLSQALLWSWTMSNTDIIGWHSHKWISLNNFNRTAHDKILSSLWLLHIKIHLPCWLTVNYTDIIIFDKGVTSWQRCFFQSQASEEIL